MTQARETTPRAKSPQAEEQQMSTGDSSPSSQVGFEEANALNGSARERPVRKQLQKTKIDSSFPVEDSSVNENAATTEGHEVREEIHAPAKNPPLDRARRKRSYEALEEDGAGEQAEDKANKHSRKRSRSSDEASMRSQPRSDTDGGKTHNDKLEPSELDSSSKTAPDRPQTPEVMEQEVLNDDVVPLASPQNKRRRQFTEDRGPEDAEASSENHDLKQADAVQSTAAKTSPSSDETKGEQIRDDQSQTQSSTALEANKVRLADSLFCYSPNSYKQPSLSGAFSDSSAKSPFASLSESKSPFKDAQTSKSAFQASGFATFANAARSPFASVPSTTKFGDSTSKGSALGSAFGSKSNEDRSSFTSMSNASPFATSGFGSLGGTSTLKGFAGISGSTLKPFVPIGGPKSAKGFGLSNKSDDEREASDENDQQEALESYEPEETDSRFFEQSGELYDAVYNRYQFF